LVIISSLEELFFPGKSKAVLPTAMFLAENVSEVFSSLSLHLEINATHGIYKLFSSIPLDRTALDRVFTSWEVAKSRHWKAYPRFNPPEVRQPE